MIRWWMLRLKRSPKWVVSATIILVSSLVFLVWSSFYKSNARHSNTAGNVGNDSAVASMDFDLSKVVLCGNSLVDFTTGQIIRKSWLEGFDNSVPPFVRVIPAEKLVICGNRGQAQAFTFGGKAKSPVKFQDKRLGPAGFSFSDSKVVFVREGNLWLGSIDWKASTVKEAKRITDTGYFRDDIFHGDWFWSNNTLFVPVMGRTHRVDLASGSVSQDQANIGLMGKGASPDIRFSITGLGSGIFSILDFAKNEAKQLNVHGSLKEFIWLDSQRLAYGSNRTEISIYDTISGKIEGPYQVPAIPLKFTEASLKGGNLLVATKSGQMIFATRSGKFTAVNLPMDDGAWLSDEAFLCSNSSTDTSVRGIWKVGVDGSKEMISGQPCDDVRNNRIGNPMVRVSNGAVWISGGNLWCYDAGARRVKQLTQGQALQPSLQLLSATKP